MKTRIVLPLLLVVSTAAAVWVWQPWEPSRKRFFEVVAQADAAPPEHVVFVSNRDAGITVEVVAKDFTLPWDVAFVGESELLVTEKAGKLWRVNRATGARAQISGMPEVKVQGQGGLHAVVLHPKFADNGLIYLSYAAPDGKGANTHVMRAKLDGAALSEQTVLFKAQAPSDRGQHFGGAMVFDREGFLLFSVGDRGERDDAQKLSTHNGKVMRLHDDGSVPKDNPFVNTPGALPEIWSFGHRNPQGLALDPVSGKIWEAEHGPQGGDEVNVIERGRNYGWPVITYGREYGSGSKIGDGTARDDVAAPAHHYIPSIATAGIAYYAGEAFPQWKDSVFVAALRGHLNRVQFKDGVFVREERLLTDENLRVRAVRVSPQGELFVVADDGVIVRVSRAR